MYVKEDEVQDCVVPRKRAGMKAALESESAQQQRLQEEAEYQAASTTERKRRLGLMDEEEHLALEVLHQTSIG